MVLKKIFLISSLSIAFLNAAQSLAMPPSIPVIDMKKKSDLHSSNKNTILKECEMIPPMMILLPPPMEEALVTCKNQLNIPKKDYAEKQLSKYFKKKIKVKKIEIVEGFNQVYKITYNGGIIFTTKSVNKFLK